MAFQDGKLMRLALGDIEVFHEASVDLSGSRSFKEIVTKDTDGTENVPSTKTWSCSVEGYVGTDATSKLTLKAVVDMWNDGDLVAAKISDEVTGNTEFTGNVYVEGWNIKAQTDEVVTFSYTLKGDKSLTVGTVS